MGENPDTGPLSPLQLDAWQGMQRTYTRLRRELDRELLAAEGLPLTAYEVLLCLAQADGNRLRMREISDSMLLSRSGLTGLIDDLERRGYVERQRASSDGRGIEARLTRTGKTKFRRAQRVHLAGVREKFVSRLAEEQLEKVAEVWEALEKEAGPDAAG